MSLFSTNLLTRPQPVRLQVPVHAERVVVVMVVVVMHVTVIVAKEMVFVMRSGGDGDCAICNFTEQTLDLAAPNHLLMHLYPQPPTLQPHNYPHTCLPHLR